MHLFSRIIHFLKGRLTVFPNHHIPSLIERNLSPIGERWRSQREAGGLGGRLSGGLWAGFLLLPLTISAQPADTLAEARALALRPLQVEVASHFTLDSAALARQSVADLPDALRHLPGLTLRDYGGAGGLTTVSVHGMGAAHTQILTDGLPAGDAFHGGLDLSRYALPDVGALTLTVADQPDLLCPVRTLAAASLNLESAQPERSVSLAQSSWNTWEVRARYAPHTNSPSPLGGVGGGLSFLHAPNDYPFSWNGATQRRSHSRHTAFTGQTSSRNTFSRGTLTASARYWLADSDLPGPVIYYNPDAGTEHNASQEAAAQCRWQAPTAFGRYYLAARYSWQRTHYTDDAVVPIAPPDQLYAQHEGYLSGGLSASPLRFLSLAYAADATFQTLSVTPATLLTAAATPRRFALQQAASARLHYKGLTITARLLHHYFREPRALHPESSPLGGIRGGLHPSLALAYRPCRSLILRAHYKDYFRPPTFAEAYYHHLGNAALRPELTRQGGLGFTLKAPQAPSLSLAPPSLPYWGKISLYERGDVTDSELSPKGGAGRGLPLGGVGGGLWALEGLLFYGRVADRIVSIPYNLFLFRTINADRVTTAGLDLSARGSLPVRRCLLTAAATYSYQRVTSQGLQLPYTPHHSGTISFAAEHPWLSGSVSLVATGSRWTTLEHAPTTLLPRYATLNLSLWRRFGPVRAKAEILNLTNAQYCVIARYPMPGIAYRLALAYYY